MMYTKIYQSLIQFCNEPGSFKSQKIKSQRPYVTCTFGIPVL